MRQWLMVGIVLSLLTACSAFPLASPTPTPTPTPTPPPYTQPGWWRDAVFYEVFVRSFYDSNGDGNGDLRGLIEKLDYLNDGNPNTTTDLGITALWLMPIMESPSYHGYDVVDYYTVEKDYGTNEDFKALVEAAHARGISVIIDLVLNHTSNTHPWFIDAQLDPASPYRDWYIWRDEPPTTKQGPFGANAWYEANGRWYYAAFWSGMPDLNYTNPDVTAEMYRVADYWLTEMGVDGFRLDAVRYIIEDDLGSPKAVLASSPETLEWLKAFRQHVQQTKPTAFIVGEIWSDSLEIARYVQAEAVDTGFEFNLAEAILRSANEGAGFYLRQALDALQRLYPAGRYSPFLTNHDQPRVMNAVGADPAKARLAAITYLTLPGTPFLYYGEEIGMRGTKPDEKIRTPMQWSAEANAGFTTGHPWIAVNPDYKTVNVAAQAVDEASLLSTYRRLIHLRANFSALRTGRLTLLQSSAGPVVAYLRDDEAARFLVVLNYAAKIQENVTLTFPAELLPAGTYRLQSVLESAPEIQLDLGPQGGSLALGTLGPQTALIYQLLAPEQP